MRTTNGVLQQPTAGQVYATLASSVTPNDSNALVDVTRYVYVGTAGNLTVIMADDATQTPVTFTAVPAGTVLPIAVVKIMATGTSAGALIALF
ncbi:MAG: hypothetical protein QOF32_1445 [Gammaproteobacteria bacterium]|jgi:hypothetical protein|nr:hypothetical protein [Gammaproteobacteria bacterium]